MEQQTQVNLEFKYALGMGLDEPGIDACSLLVHRRRLIQKGLDKSLLQRFIYLLYCLGILTGKEPFLTDTTHSIAPVSEQSALGLIQQSLCLVLHRLEAIGKKEQAPEEIRYLATKVRWSNDSLPEIIKIIDTFLTWLEQQPELKQDVALRSRVGCLGRIMKERIIRHADGSVG